MAVKTKTTGSAVADPAAEALLDAGAVLRTGTTVAKPDTVDALDARAYRHPVLGQRRVVRLTTAALGGAEDLTMEFLGFSAAPAVTRVGLVRQQALGFPAWAVVHDPANGHHALALVKDIERLARMAKSRVGPAKDGFTELGARLARAVPHFLPTYYEQAGRAFLAADSASYAAMMFGKAREAEQMYALSVDEERTHAVFLEFALAGALTAKALTGYARELAARRAPEVAYERFRRLCLERTLGGMPPYAAMPTDLRRLAKAAGLGAEADDQVLRDLLEAPAVLRAPEAFWSAYQPVLVRLAQADPAVAARLLTMLPEHCSGEVWLGILVASGATAILTAPAGTARAGLAPPDGAAGWLGRFAQHRRGGYRYRNAGRPGGLLELVREMAPRLIADGVPTPVAHGWSTDLDLVDLCLALGVPVADPAANGLGQLGRWLGRDPADRRDLVATAADPRFLPLLVKGVEGHLPDKLSEQSVAAVVAVPGLRTAVHAWLDELAEAVVGQGLATLGHQLDRVRMVASAQGLAVNPAAVARIAGHDLAPVLGRTLRAGVLDEFGWPALESAVAGLADAGKESDLATSWQWPELLVRNGDRVAVVGPDAVVLEHHLRIPADQRRYLWNLVLRYVDGQLLVCWDTGPDRSGYWSGTPDDVFTKVDDAAFGRYGQFLALPGGGRTAGARPLHVGDRAEQRRGPVVTDGVNYWVLHERDLHEFDPATGALGRASLPAFFAAGAVPDEPLVPGDCWLRTVPAGSVSPLGTDGGLVGWRVRATRDGGLAGTGVDGRSFTLDAAARRGTGGTLSGAIRFPGAAAVYGVRYRSGWRDSQVTIVDTDGFVVARYEEGASRPGFARGTALVPPVPYLHHMRPRDAAGSAALRALTDDAAGTLLAAAAGHKFDAVRPLVAAALPGITHPDLLAGVTGVVRLAAKRAAALREFAAILAGTAAPAGTAKAAAPVVDADAGLARDTDLAGGLRSLIQYCSTQGASALRMIDAAGAALAGAPPVSTVDTKGGVDIKGDKDWLDALGLVPAAMYRAASPVTEPAHREALLALLEHVVAAGLLAPGSRLRYASLVTSGAIARRGRVLTTAHSRALVVYADDADRSAGTDRSAIVLEFAPDGRFGAPSGYRITGQTPLTDGTIDPDAVLRLVAQVRAQGPVPWRPELVAALSQRAGISLAEAGVLLAGLPADVDRVTGGTAQAPVPALLEPKPAVVVAARTWQRAARTSAAGLLHGLLPADPVRLWHDGPDLDRMAAWAATRGVRTPVADDLIVAVDKGVTTGALGASELLHGLNTPDTCTWLNGSGSGYDDDDVLVALARVLPWLVYHLPADAPLRGRLVEAVRRFTARLADPAFAVPAGYLDADKVPAFAAATGYPPATAGEQVELGPYLLDGTGDWRSVTLRPALLRGLDDPAWAAYRAFVDDEDGERDAVTALRIALRGDLAQVVAPVAGATAGGYPPQDPTRSVPQVVAQAAAGTGLGPDAAALYLQLLALPDPTDRNVAAWTGWKPARLKAARAELAASAHVVTAKRARAGRTVFLPGGWLALRAPHLPVEAWKIPLLTLDPDGRPRFGSVVPALPVPELFARAWARVRDGDGPRFDQLVTERRR